MKTIIERVPHAPPCRHEPGPLSPCVYCGAFPAEALPAWTTETVPAVEAAPEVA